MLHPVYQNIILYFNKVVGTPPFLTHTNRLELNTLLVRMKNKRLTHSPINHENVGIKFSAYDAFLE
jgi:hypothetical protein